MRGKVLGLAALGVLAAGCGGGVAPSATPTSAPAACIDALDLVSDLRAMASEGVTAHIKANRQVSVALKAGLTHDTAAIDELLAQTKADAAQQQRYNRRLDRLLTNYEYAETACRQAGSVR